MKCSVYRRHLLKRLDESEDRSIIASELVTMKFSDVVRKARLDKSTAHYVLKSGRVRGTPNAGAKGKHRVFDAEQATRFALVTRLVMAGVQLDDAVGVIAYGERQAKEQTGWTPGKPIYGDRLRQWQLRLQDHDLLQVIPMSNAFFDDLTYYSIKQRKKVHRLPFDPPLSRFTLYLTDVEAQILDSR